VKYSLLVFTIFEGLEGPIHGGDELETFNCNYRHTEPCKNIIQQRYLLVQQYFGLKNFQIRIWIHYSIRLVQFLDRLLSLQELFHRGRSALGPVVTPHHELVGPLACLLGSLPLMGETARRHSIQKLVHGFRLVPLL
jgi:hypothetical protein